MASLGLLALIVFAILVFCNSQINSPGAISSFSPGGQYILLTFDDGPHAINTPQILDILKDKKIRASFFAIGTKGMHHKDILRRITEEKNDVGNRGWLSAQHVTKMNYAEITQHINATNRIITNATSTEVKYFRPPHGLTNAHINTHIKAAHNMKVILWSLDSNDLKNNDPDTVTANILAKAKPGDVIHMHDTQEVTVKALPGIIDGLTEQGYEFLTLTQVISFPDDSPH